MSTFKQIGLNRYQVLYPEDHPIVVKRRKATSRYRPGENGMTLAGTVLREDFTTYRKNKPVKGFFWIGYTPGYVQIEGTFKTRELVAEMLLKGA